MLKITGFTLLVLAYVALIPGLTQPMLTVQGSVERSELIEEGRKFLTENQQPGGFINEIANMLVQTLDVSGTIQAYDKTRSILGTAHELFANQHAFVALLILLFSVVVPVVKGVLAGSTLLPIQQNLKDKFMTIGDLLSKWSMADVFVVGVFVAFLAASGMQEGSSLVKFDAQLGAGFYYFLTYCLLSILATQLIGIVYKRDTAAAAQ